MVLLAPVLVLALLTGCLGRPDADLDAGDPRGALGVDGAGAPAGAEAAQAGPDDAPALTPGQMRSEAARVVDRRAAAVRTGDEGLFRSTLGGGRAAQERQLRWFRNVSALPWAEFDYEVTDLDWAVARRPRWGRAVLVPRLVLRTRLDGFDAVPVERTVGLVVSFGADGTGRVVDDRDASGAPLVEDGQAPWDVTRTHVRERAGVLGVFDDQTVGSAPQVMSAVQQGIADVSASLPFDWSRRVVVYAVGDPSALATFTDVPGGSVELLGALTFPVRAQPGRGEVASSRMLLLPGSVAAGQPFLGRITRHELSHVAIGQRDDGAPTWFSEGLAEYLGARTVPLAQRTLPTDAVRRATGPVGGLPTGAGFNGPDQDWHYALSWMSLDALVATDGEGVLWRLLDAFGAQLVTDPDARTDEVLRSVTGRSEAQVAADGARRIRELYG